MNTLNRVIKGASKVALINTNKNSIIRGTSSLFSTVSNTNTINNNNNSIESFNSKYLNTRQFTSTNVTRHNCEEEEDTHYIMSHCPHQQQQIRIRKPAPKFTAQAVVDGEFKTVSLDDYKGKYVYLFFYPLDFTFVCPTEILAFSERAEDFRKIGCEILACSIDSQFSHLAWINTPRKQGGLGGIKFPIISDITHQISKDYGVYIPEDGHTIRGSFIIGDDGLVKQITMNDNPVGRSVDEALRLVQAYQYTDKHGEVCPANWQQGGKTMIPDPVKSKAYFESAN